VRLALTVVLTLCIGHGVMHLWRGTLRSSAPACDHPVADVL